MSEHPHRTSEEWQHLEEGHHSDNVSGQNGEDDDGLIDGRVPVAESIEAHNYTPSRSRGHSAHSTHSANSASHEDKPVHSHPSSAAGARPQSTETAHTAHAEHDHETWQPPSHQDEAEIGSPIPREHTYQNEMNEEPAMPVTPEPLGKPDTPSHSARNLHSRGSSAGGARIPSATTTRSSRLGSQSFPHNTQPMHGEGEGMIARGGPPTHVTAESHSHPNSRSASAQHATHVHTVGKDGRPVKAHVREVQQLSRWEPVDYEGHADSDDEFELSTCLAPVYAENPEADEVNAQFKNGTPDYTGETMSCFDDPNLLYRIINHEQKTWAFYNDSLNYEMHVQFTFGKNSKIEPLENTRMEKQSSGEYVCEVVVYPRETELFVKGDVNGFTSKLRAVPLSEEYHRECHRVTEQRIVEEKNVINQISSSDNAEVVLQACIANNVPFVDPEFPPCQESLDGGISGSFKPLAWARPSMYLPEEMATQVRLFRSHPQPGVVDPGDLGDTWVMCSVSSVSEDPQRLQGMFRHPEGKEAAQREHAVGAYRVTFSKNGWWRSVLVDDYLPISAGRPKFARSAKDPAEIWPSILQKAYAKLHGSYAAIITGDPLHALHDMTGFSTYRFDDALAFAASGNDETIFKELVNGVKAGYTIIVNTGGKDPRSAAKTGESKVSSELEKVGLLPGHAYTILDAKHFPDVHDARIVKVRNAWGSGLEWNGDWSDEDAKWHQYPEVAEACHFRKAADGTFWMSWHDCLKHFNGGGICFSHKPVYDYRINSAFYDHIPSCVLELDVKTPTWVTLVISQEDKRGRADGTDYQPVMISTAVPAEYTNYKVLLNSTASGTRPSAEKWTFLQARDVSLVTRLEAGKYVVVPRLMPGSDRPSEVPYVLGLITNQEIGAGGIAVNFKRIDKENRVFENYPKFDPELLPCDQEVQYQKRAPGAGFPETQMGQSVE